MRTKDLINLEEAFDKVLDFEKASNVDKVYMKMISMVNKYPADHILGALGAFMLGSSKEDVIYVLDKLATQPEFVKLMNSSEAKNYISSVNR